MKTEYSSTVARKPLAAGTRPKQGMTLIELLAVVAVVLILLGLLIPAINRVRDRGQGAVCMSNMRQLSTGMLNYAGDNEGFFPWAGGVDRNSPEDWAWGGQPRADTENKAYWANPPSTFGHHAEAGSIFTYMTGLSRITNGVGKNGIDETIRTIYPVYRCPSTGIAGEALRINYSMNDKIDTQLGGAGGSTALGVKLSHVKKISEKILLVNEDPRTMHNASFAPGGSADGDDGQGTAYDGGLLQVSHYGGINISFMDGHVGRFTEEEVRSMQSTTLNPSGISNRDHYFEILK